LGLGGLCQSIGDRWQAERHLAIAADMHREMGMTLGLEQAEAALKEVG
jgi:hypothetical protein